MSHEYLVYYCPYCQRNWISGKKESFTTKKSTGILLCIECRKIEVIDQRNNHI